MIFIFNDVGGKKGNKFDQILFDETVFDLANSIKFKKRALNFKFVLIYSLRVIIKMNK